MNERPLTPAVVRDKPEQLPVATDGAPSSMIQYAMSKGSSISELKELYALQQQFEADQAKKAYTVAMAAFKREPMEILKRKLVAFGETKYFHAELSDVTAVVVPAMALHGLMHQWNVRQDNGGVTVDCIITHELGHSEKVTMSAAPDASGKKNAIQQIASAVQYLQRYTLLAATGMSTTSMHDDDGRGAGSRVELINDDQFETLRSKMQEVGADEHAFLKTLKLERLDDLPTTAYGIAIGLLEAKGKAKK